MLVHNPALSKTPLRPEFARMAWREALGDLAARHQGRTGIPLVDAAPTLTLSSAAPSFWMAIWPQITVLHWAGP